MVNNLNFPHFFRVFVYLPKNAGNCKLTNKHKTEKEREIQIIQIIQISYIFCALKNWFLKSYVAMKPFFRLLN